MHSTVAPSGGRMHYSGNTSSHKNRRSVLERLSLLEVKFSSVLASFSIDHHFDLKAPSQGCSAFTTITLSWPGPLESVIEAIVAIYFSTNYLQP